MTDRIEPEPEPAEPDGQLPLGADARCDYCGTLGWTLEHHGKIVHKHHCPHRTDDCCQAHPAGGCADADALLAAHPRPA